MDTPKQTHTHSQTHSQTHTHKKLPINIDRRQKNTRNNFKANNDKNIFK